MSLTLTDLLAMDRAELKGVLHQAHPIPPGSVEDTRYLGVDLSLPPLLSRLLWQTFSKVFHRDPHTGVTRGWNIKLEQHGVDGPMVPLTNPRGQPITFGHYQLRSARGVDFPWGWHGEHYLDYTVAGNKRRDPAGLALAPLVAVNHGSSELLLGWEIVKLGPRMLPLPLYWALKRVGSLPADQIVEVPRPKRAVYHPDRMPGQPRSAH